MHSSFRAEAYVIHEMLHSLGLGENPPSSLAITAKVMSRCHAAPALVADVAELAER
jgi:hypothetical protein